MQAYFCNARLARFYEKWFKGDAKEQFKMDFKKCSEVYGYKSIAEVEEEELAEKIAHHDESIAKTMFKAGKITQDDAISFFNIPEEVARSWKR